MRILRLHLQNVHALRNQWTLQFDAEPLQSAGLFAITGPTGGGKSSLLDAMIVALYGRVPRYGSSTPNDLMTRHTGETLVELDFAVEQGRYRARWNLRRARGKAEGRLQPPRHELQNLDQGTTLDLRNSEVPRKVEELTGLNLEQFQRSVILPQGEFAAFLRASERERGELLEELTGLHIYSELGQFAYQCRQAEEHKLQQLQDKLGAIPLLPPEQRKELERQLAEQQQQRPLLLKQAETLQAQLDWLKQCAKVAQECVEHKNAYEAAEGAVQNFHEQQQRLDRHNLLVPLRPEWKKLQKLESTAEQREHERRTLQNQLALQQALLTASGKAFREAEAALTANSEQMQRLEPQIRKAQELDVRLQPKREQVAQRQQDVQRRQQELASQQELIAQEQANLQHAEAQHQQHEQWLQNREAHQQLDEKLPQLQERCQVWRSHQQQIRELDARLADLAQELQRTDRQLHEAQRQHADQAEELFQRQQQSSQQQQREKDLLGERSLGDCQQRQTELMRMLHRIERLQQLTTQHQATRQKLLENQRDLKQNEVALERHKQQIESLQSQLEQTRERLHDKQRILDQARLIQNYEEARRELHPGAPCPLCGSLEHPYVLKIAQPQQADSTLVDQLQARCAAMEAEQNQHAHAETRLQSQREQLQQREAELSEQEQQYQTEFAELAEGFSCRIDQAEVLEAFHKKRLAEYAELETLLQQANELFQTREQAQQELDNIRKQLQELQTQSATLQERLRQQSQEQSKCQRQRDEHRDQAAALHDELREKLQHYHVGEELLDLSSALETLQSLHHEFRERAQQRDQAWQRQSQHRALLQYHESQAKQSQEALQQLQAELAQQQAAVVALQTERRQILEHDDPVQLEAELRQQKQRLQAHYETARQRRENVLAEHGQVQQRLRWLQDEHRRWQQEYADLRMNVSLSLRALGYASYEEAESHYLNEHEAQTLRQQSEALQRALSNTRHALGNIQMQQMALREQQLTTEPEEGLQAKVAEVRGCQSELDERVGSLRQQLTQDEAMRQSQQALTEEVQQQQQEVRRWSSVADLIGSADGTKFSRFAQSLTLRHLIQLANQHLRRLTDRYRLRKKEDAVVEMEILDRYQADTIRSLESLSGGETFLVSLALALGLSDLARRNHPIETLFIDEGFGTLDTETLDTALSALETLQADGKTIGIISHVEALKERLTTQIQVQKHDSGNSRLRIVPTP
jgi:exonuclease SbcC